MSLLSSLTVAAAALIISFVCLPEIVNVGLAFEIYDDVKLPLLYNACVEIFSALTTGELEIKKKIFSALTTEELEIKKKIFSALTTEELEIKKNIFSALKVKTLPLNGQQSVLVQLWSPTKAGKTYLLYTWPSFGYCGTDEGLLVYRGGCLRHAFYIHREKNVFFGLPGRAFMEGTPQQTQNVHNYPVDERPPFEDNAIFSMKWGSFAVPVILNAECVGVLEFVMTGPTGRYDELMKEVGNALQVAGFQSSLNLDTPRRTGIAKHDATKETGSSKKKTRTTQSSIFAHYNILVPFFGLTKKDAMERIKSRFHLKKEVTEGAFDYNLRNKVGITEWPCIQDTHSRASSSAPELSEAASSNRTPESVSAFACDAVISEQLREQTSTPMASAYEAQLNQTPLEASLVAEMSSQQTPTIEPSSSSASVHELAKKMDEDEDDQGVLDQGIFNDIWVGFEECIYDKN